MNPPQQQQQQQPNDNDDDDKLRNGPCQEVFAALLACQKRHGIQQPKHALTRCVNETDRLITCIHKHPAHFQATKQ